MTISRIEWSYCASASISKKKKTLCIIVALHSKYTGALTFENFVMQSISQKKKLSMRRISEKILYVVALHSQYTGALTFANFANVARQAPAHSFV